MISHPMMPDANHDERAEQLFVRDFKKYISTDLEPQTGRLAEAVNVEADIDGDIDRLRDNLFDYHGFRTWVALKRTAQEVMWDVVSASVDRQQAALSARADIAAPLGSLLLDADLEAPDYITAQDVHLMPGGYAADDGDVRQGAIMDRGGAVYMLGLNGGPNGAQLNDARGKAVIAHLLAVYPEFKPTKILELGCGVGASTTAIARYFPDSDIYGVDIGPSMLRYAHARAESMGVRAHFSQQNAEATNFADESFDFVFTAAVFHETSAQAIPKILAEARRLLRPGGVMIHLEVPTRYQELSLWQKMNTEYETHFNNEPCWRVATSADYRALCQAAGFSDVKVGYQKATFDPQPGKEAFLDERPSNSGSWYVVSAMK